MGMIVRNEKTYTGISSASLSTLTDVALETPVNGQGLVYNEELQKWVNGDVTSGGATTGTLKPWLYSEEETVIGNYMGKPLYRKIILISGEVNLTQSGSIYYKIYTMEELGLETGEIINVKGTIMRAQSGYETTKYTFPFTDTYNKESVMSLYFFPTSLKIESEIDQSKSGITFSDPIFTVEYIKDSDEEGSGDSLMPYCGGSSTSSVNYSTEEQVVGTWIDGSTLYQKTYDITGITIDANKWYSYPIDNTEINTVVKIEGYRVAPNQTTPLNQSATSNGVIQGCTFSYNSNIPGFYIIPTSDNTDTQIHYYITIQYTKK